MTPLTSLRLCERVIRYEAADTQVAVVRISSGDSEVERIAGCVSTELARRRVECSRACVTAAAAAQHVRHLCCRRAR